MRFCGEKITQITHNYAELNDLSTSKAIIPFTLLGITIESTLSFFD